MRLLGKLNSDYHSGFSSCRPGTIVIVELSYQGTRIAIALAMVAHFDPTSFRAMLVSPYFILDVLVRAMILACLLDPGVKQALGVVLSERPPILKVLLDQDLRPFLNAPLRNRTIFLDCSRAIPTYHMACGYCA